MSEVNLRRAPSTHTPPVLPMVEQRVARECYLAACSAAPPCLADAAGAWLETIQPPRWALEWSLPFWLGESLGLPSKVTRRLVLSNVVGLAYVRLQDAWADGEILPFRPTVAPLLATLLYRRWMQEYIDLFGSEQKFWAPFDQYLTEWLAATASSNDMPEHSFRDYGPDDFLRLAQRGAPLKVCVAGACVLAGREDLLAALTDAIDHLLVSAVLLDHAQDWSDDLAAGRYNAFVAYASPLPQTPEYRQINERSIQQEICLHKAGRPYFRVARDHLRIARKRARPANCPDLQRYLSWLDQQAATCGERLAGNAAALLNDAVRRLFGPMVSTDAEQPDSRKGDFSND
ncbi:MAG: hypothetical protein MUC51_09235 [Anaerolineae bacterium]|nr:hypothetical protein [Anaerolineae bacterium]